MSAAETVDYAQAADVFWCVSARRQMPRGSMRFRKFPSLDAAVRFLLGDKSETRYQCTIDTDVAHYEAAEIAELFGRPDFPGTTVPSRRIGLDQLEDAKAVPA